MAQEVDLTRLAQAQDARVAPGPSVQGYTGGAALGTATPYPSAWGGLPEEYRPGTRDFQGDIGRNELVLSSGPYCSGQTHHFACRHETRCRCGQVIRASAVAVPEGL
jgi:hypothetical protein